MIVLVVNCGSSSIKYQLFEMPDQRVIAKGLVERIGDEGSALVYEHDGKNSRLEQPVPDHEAGVALILKALVSPDGGVIKDIGEIKAVGHRVVHGGEAFTGSVLINDEVIASIEKVADLAPLHNPPNLTGIRAAQHAMPSVPQIACFDTAFHNTIPQVAYMYALPYELYEKFGIRRYGFHGTSHRWVARRAAEMLGRHKYEINCITCHLGNGSSIAAVKDGKSVDTSMGLTPLEGVVMGTRSGDIDPAILFYLTDKGYSVADLNKLCNKQSGVLGLSGSSNDMRTLGDKAKAGDERAQLALDVFAYRIKKYIGTYTAVLGKLDAVVFTGGIGENAAGIRAAICGDLDQIGIELAPGLNQGAAGGEMKISSENSRVAVLVIPTNEEAAIAIDTYQMSQACLEIQ
jgi:acetate kinase